MEVPVDVITENPIVKEVIKEVPIYIDKNVKKPRNSQVRMTEENPVLRETVTKGERQIR